MMADFNQYSNALLKRHDQLKRWNESDTNKELPHVRESSRKIKFHDGCVFLAACSAGDAEEVKRLIEQGADINTANVDGLTALHQACIDDNLDMVEFLVGLDADIDVCDNEGWTPLHATSSCGFSEIARYLVKIGANIASVNNDGDLAIDICEDHVMEKFLQEEMEKQGIDADAARRDEEERMLADAKQWLNNRHVKEKKHPKTGATALHVATAKGYIKVMHILFQTGVDVNAKDVDGWTPLHAAAHWGQEEACKLLTEHMCDMELSNNNGQTAFDVADSDMVQLLEELKKKQASLRDKQESQKDIIQTKGPQHLKRRSSVTRMSVDQKQNVKPKNVEQERAQLELFTHNDEKKPGSGSVSEDDCFEDETEKQNEINRKSSQDEVIIISDSEPSTPQSPIIEMPKISEIEEKKNEKKEEKKNEEIELTKPEEEEITKEPEKIEEKNNEGTVGEPANNSSAPTSQPVNKWDAYSRQISAPARIHEQVPDITVPSSQSSGISVPSWRSGLRKTGSTSLVNDSLNKENEADKNLPRSASSPRLTHGDNINNNKTDSDRPSFRRPFLSSNTPSSDNQPSQTNEKYGSIYGRSTYTPYRSLSQSSGTGYQSAYVPYYRRVQEQQSKKQEQEEEEKSLQDKDVSGPSTVESSSTPTITTAAITTRPSIITISTASITMPTSTTTSSTTTTSTLTTNLLTYRRSYEPPKRDEETETQRKAKAKRARETRRSTQGVTLEDVKKAEETLRQSDVDKEKKAEEPKESKANERVRPTSLETNERVRPTSLETKDDQSSSALRRRAREDRLEDKKDDSSEIRTSGSFRRSRENRDTTDYQSSYVPRSQRNALPTGSVPSSTTSQNSISKSTSFRSRIRNGDVDNTEEERRKEAEQKRDDDDKREEKREPTALRARRARRERRSTGISSYSPDADEDGDGRDESKQDDNKKEDTKKESETDTSSVGSRYGSRYGSSETIPSYIDRHSSLRDRPSSYSDYSKSTSALDTDYKKLYEDEKLSHEKVKRELEQVKKELSHSKEELDKQLKLHEQTRLSESADKREKRTLERRVSEYEEELKQMEKLKAENARYKEENRALTRVVAKLSR